MLFKFYISQTNIKKIKEGWVFAQLKFRNRL